MPYTKSPTMDTYSEEEIDLTREISIRPGYSGSSVKDEDYVNVFIEHIKSKEASDNRMYLIKRSGTSSFLASYVAGDIRGSLFWRDQQKLYYSVGTDVRVYNFGTGTGATIAGVFASSTGDVGFAEYIYDDGTVVLIASDGNDLVQISTTNVVTTCVDPDLPSPHDPHIVFLDGYIFLIKKNTGDIYNSNANDPLAYDAADFINAEIEADYLQRLIKVNNYLVGLGSETIEYLWDAAVATGSPMQRNDTPVKRIEYLSGLAQEQNTSYFIGKDHNSTLQVYKLYDFKAEVISTPRISAYLSSVSSNPTTWFGNVVSFSAHMFYVITAGTKTWCYNLETGIWSRLSYQGGTDFKITHAHNIINTTSPALSIFSLNDGTTAWNVFSDVTSQDNSVTFPCIITTSPYDFGTLNRKTMSRLYLYGDRPPIDANITVQWTTNDYQTFNTGVTTNMNQELPCVRQLGSFRQIAFKLTFSANTSFRIQKLRANINKGSS